MKKLFIEKVKQIYPKAKLAYSGSFRTFYIRNLPFSMLHEAKVKGLASKFAQSIVII